MPRLACSGSKSCDWGHFKADWHLIDDWDGPALQDGRTDGRTDGWINGRTDERTDGQTNTDGWSDICAGGRTDEPLFLHVFYGTSS